MGNARTSLRDYCRRGLPEVGARRRGILVGGLAVASAAVLAGCDSVSGIPGDDPAPASPARVTTTTAATTTTSGDTPGNAAAENPDGTAAVGAWVADLRAGDVDAITEKCWSIAPSNAAAMYAEPESILAALENPPVRGESGMIWSGAAVTVVASDRTLAGDYACPRVYRSGNDLGFDTELGFNGADARHTVRRYLARFTGEPLDPADQEGTYPLVCAATPGSWDPEQTGQATTPPLALNPGQLTGVTSFIDQSIESAWPDGGYITVSVPVTNASGVQQKRTFTLKSGDEGYCIGDVSP
ncbi:hypothetical protein IU474_13245 [Nocardia otitidiscaviarum]|uniref:hypothetical protein n=1 Tax=Nocardia otitidiscaviarum TaxID=1823 RepID=UPI001893B9BF|nr:hypothetical protein [Nocardia otitidiscaviarum]MBF6238028.1 hypothetical protein [Nocardia otitidiscaviarum]